MTFSSAFLSLCEVDDVAATAAGVTGLSGGVAGNLGRWRGGAGTIGMADATLAVTLGAAAGTVMAVAGAAAGIVFGMRLRATGRGFGRGTFWAISSFAAKAAMATETVSAPANAAESAMRAVDRSAAASGKEVTAFLRGESWGRLRVSCN